MAPKLDVLALKTVNECAYSAYLTGQKVVVKISSVRIPRLEHSIILKLLNKFSLMPPWFAALSTMSPKLLPYAKTPRQF